MEYALNQSVIFDAEGTRHTGKIAGKSGENFIVTLDQRLCDGTKIVLVPSGSVRPLTCHACEDDRKVLASSFTMAQLESGDIPKVDCPYCKEVR